MSRRQSVLFGARVTGHVMWWIFVVSALFAGGISWWREYSAVDASFVSGLYGFTIYTPTTGAGYIDLASSPSPQWWQDPAVYALTAFVLLVVAAVVDAIATRQVLSGIVTVLVPFVALALFALATPGAINGVFLHSAVALLLVLVGVAVREVWMRALAPNVQDWHHE
ncbi:hypothetical protein ACWFOS_17075 [Gordonia terrae]